MAFGGVGHHLPGWFQFRSQQTGVQLALPHINAEYHHKNLLKRERSSPPGSLGEMLCAGFLASSTVAPDRKGLEPARICNPTLGSQRCQQA
jgi:hypothetical protein